MNKLHSNHKCTNQPRWKLWIRCRGFRFNFNKTRILTIIALHNRYNHFGFHKSGMTPYVIKDFPETGFIEMKRISINIWWLVILITKYERFKD